MYLLGIDLGSSSIKLAVIESRTGKTVAAAQYPADEMRIDSLKADWAEQDPDEWWRNLAAGMRMIGAQMDTAAVGAIGIAYQMHGLVCVDNQQRVVRPAVIWCDSRAVGIGRHAFGAIGPERCLITLLNSPGNFTASKLAWVKRNEPENFVRIHKIMLPGDFIAMRLTGEITTTVSGLSEGILWDYATDSPADFLLDYYGISPELLAGIVPTFANQGVLTKEAAQELGLTAGIPVSYRAGDQPNNAFALNVLKPGEIAATAGTSGVVYAVGDQRRYDPKSRVNIFAHVNHQPAAPRYGILLCINGTGSFYHWMKKNVGGRHHSYDEMNAIAATAPIGSDGVTILPFGNGAERMLENKNPGAALHYLNFNIHSIAHLYRAAQEGIAFSFRYGIDLMAKYNGLRLKTIRAANANLFLSPVFAKTLASVTGCPIDIYATDGAAGAARGAGVGIGAYRSVEEAFSTLRLIHTITPDEANSAAYQTAYDRWHAALGKINNLPS